MRLNPPPFTAIAIPLLIAATMMVGGCTPESARWSPVESAKENKIDFITMAHQVRFTSGAAAPAPAESRALSDFLNGIAFGYGDQVTIDAGPRSGNAGSDALAVRRVDAVIATLRKMHIKAQVASRPSVDAALSRDAVVVTVGRYVVSGPPCPDHSKPEGDDFTNTTTSNYSCATVSNLGMMVANPADLVHGTTPGPADGEFATRGVQSYRAGTMSKSLTPELSKTTGGGN
jgi:pilus assembly protein CpaD